MRFDSRIIVIAFTTREIGRLAIVRLLASLQAPACLLLARELFRSGPDPWGVHAGS